MGNDFGDFLDALADESDKPQMFHEPVPDRPEAPSEHPKDDPEHKTRKRGNQHSSDPWGPETDAIIELIIHPPAGIEGEIMPWVDREKIVGRPKRSDM